MRRFETVRRGTLGIDVSGNLFQFDVRVVREAADLERFFTITGSAISGDAHDSLAAACQSLEQSSEHAVNVVWRANVNADKSEKACFACGAGLGEPFDANSRYPELLCPACVLEAVDEEGRSLTFANVDGSGGFVAHCVDTGESSGRHLCFVRGRACWADEAHFGGIVVIPHEK